MRKVACFILVAIVFCITSCSKDDLSVTSANPGDSTTFTNPLLGSGPDPWVITKDGFFYYTHTSGNRIQLWKTRAMSQLHAAIPVTIWTKPVTGPNSENVWAPELHYLKNKWYVYFTAGSGDVNTSQRLFVLENEASDPTTGSWIEKGQVKDPANDFWSADAHVFDYKGTLYLLWSGHASFVDRTQRLYIAGLENPWTMATARVEICRPTYDWEQYGSPPAVTEGPQVIRNSQGNLFLVYSASGCWTDNYGMGIMFLRGSENPLNAADWVKSPLPVFSKKPENGAYGPGHCAFFKSADGKEDWLLYHANSSAGQGCGDARNPRMQQFFWNNDGTPKFGEPVKINTPITKPSGE